MGCSYFEIRGTLHHNIVIVRHCARETGRIKRWRVIKMESTIEKAGASNLAILDS